MARRPKPWRSGREGCAPMGMECRMQARTVDCIIRGSLGAGVSFLVGGGWGWEVEMRRWRGGGGEGLRGVEAAGDVGVVD